MKRSLDLDYLSSGEIDVDSDTGGIPILKELDLDQNYYRVLIIFQGFTSPQCSVISSNILRL